MSQPPLLLFISLYTDEDVTVELAPALRRRGYIAQSAQEASNREISDEAQLEYATTQGMAILTYNSQDFVPLAESWFLPVVNMQVSLCLSNSADDSSANCSDKLFACWTT